MQRHHILISALNEHTFMDVESILLSMFDLNNCANKTKHIRAVHCVVIK